MNKEYITGFIKRAQEAGLSTAQANVLLKQAGFDPSMADPAQGGDPAQAAPQPAPHHDPSQGAPDIGAGGVPPEIEQMIQQLPPEVLQQLLAEIQAELGNGGDAGAGADPAAGMPPKQGSEAILAKEASYQEGFLERGLNYGFSYDEVNAMYKKALEIIEPQSVQKTAAAQPTISDKQAAHFEGFLSQSRQYGIPDNEAANIYRNTFCK